MLAPGVQSTSEVKILKLYLVIGQPDNEELEKRANEINQVALFRLVKIRCQSGEEFQQTTLVDYEGEKFQDHISIRQRLLQILETRT